MHSPMRIEDNQVNSLKWWENLLCEAVASFSLMGVVWALGAWRDQPVPLWGYFLAAMAGIIMWTRPSYKRKQDFDK